MNIREIAPLLLSFLPLPVPREPLVVLPVQNYAIQKKPKQPTGERDWAIR
jgi:hypothetical protein